jgi:SOS-response transcriptional repressor LexA
MEPRFPRGSLLIVSTDITPADGDLVIVKYPHTHEATLRELSVDGPLKLLLPINNTASTDTLTPDIQIIGTVTQSRFSY